MTLTDRVARAMYEKSKDTCHVTRKIITFSRANRQQEWSKLPIEIKNILRLNARIAIAEIKK